MKQVSRLGKFNNSPYFSIDALKQAFNLSDNSLYQNIKRWLKNGLIIQLKKGMYVTQKYLDNYGDKNIYLEFLANNLRYPSYLSLEYVLQKYNILTESIYAYISVTLKTKRSYANELGKFLYFQIDSDLFIGYDKVILSGYEVKIANKSKALFDYLYYRKNRIENKNSLESLRINIDNFKRNEIKEFSRYCRLEGSKKMMNIYKFLFKKNDS
jgi:predicted transcriptional regulator of viral defense system